MVAHRPSKPFVAGSNPVSRFYADNLVQLPVLHQELLERPGTLGVSSKVGLFSVKTSSRNAR